MTHIAEIYERQIQTVYRVCFTYMKNAADAEDAASEVFIRMLRYAPVFNNEEHEKAWLIRTAINLCKDSLRHWWRRREDLTDYSEALRSEQTFETDDVTEAVLTLPKKYKAVVYLYYYEGYKGEEIAAMLGKPHSTIRNYLRQARALLRERLGEFYE
jgi:RNA polymerase sigma-70 factor (ECF subfamily)